MPLSGSKTSRKLNSCLRRCSFCREPWLLYMRMPERQFRWQKAARDLVWAKVLRFLWMQRKPRWQKSPIGSGATPETLLTWYRKLIAKKFDGSKDRKSLGRPRIDKEIECLVVRMAKENPTWGYDRIVGAMANLGHKLSDETVGNILRRNDIPPALKRKQTTSWKDFIRAHMAVMAATDFFTAEVLTLKGLNTYYVLFFI